MKLALPKRFLSSILLYQFLIASFLLNGFIIGPFSVRIYSSLVVFGYLIWNGYKYKFVKPIVLYALFIFFYFLALIFNGELGKVDFFRYFFGRYFVCFVAFFVVYSVTRSQRDVKSVLLLLVVVGFANSLVTLFQYLGNAIAISIPIMLNPTAEDRFETVFEMLDAGVDSGTFGFFGNVVENGYKASLFAVIIPFYYVSSSRRINKVILFGCIAFFGLAVFLTQQRLVTILVGLFYLYLLYRYSLVFFPLLALLFVAVLYIIIESYGVDSTNLGRLSNLQDENRSQIFNHALIFIGQNLFVGGQIQFGNMLAQNGFNVFSSHNVFLNSFIYSGLFGAIVLIFLYFKLLFTSLRAVTNRGLNSSTFIGAALGIQLLNSLTHNSSLVTGDETIWILYALLLRSNQFGNLYSQLINESSLRNR